MKPFSETEKERFNRIKELSLDVIRKIDNNKMLNYKRYEALFRFFENNPDEFRKWDVLNNDSLDSSLSVYQLPFEEMNLQQIKNAADRLKCPLEEYIYYRMNDPKGIRSRMKVPLGYVHIKRMEQILSKKNHYALDTDERSLKTGDVKGEAKVASLSDVESFALAAIGADKALEELMGPRADSTIKKQEMYRQIARDGFTTLESLSKGVSGSTTLNTLNTYLLASGIRSDLITSTLQTEFTKEKNLKG